MEDNKDIIKNVIIAIAVPAAIIGGLALFGVHNLNEFLEKNGLTDEYYSDPEDIEMEEAE